MQALPVTIFPEDNEFFVTKAGTCRSSISEGGITRRKYKI